MIRFKNFDATGIPDPGVLFAGDLNLFEDLVAAQTDFTQTISLSALAIGEANLQLLHYGADEARLTGAFRTDGVLRGLGGFIAGAFTTPDRNAITPGKRPYGLVILNTSTNQYEFNAGTDAVPVWRPLGTDPLGTIVFSGPTSSIQFTSESSSTNPILVSQTTGDAFPEFEVLTNGELEWGPGSGVLDTFLHRAGVGILRTDGIFQAGGGYQIGNAISALPAYRALQAVVDPVLANLFNLGDANYAFTIGGDGRISWGAGGANALDTVLYRGGAGIVKTDGRIEASPSAGLAAFRAMTASVADSAFAAYVSAEASPRLRIMGDGTILFGAGGGAAPDTALVRGAAGRIDVTNLRLASTTLELYSGAAKLYGDSNWMATRTTYGLLVQDVAGGTSFAEIGVNYYKFQDGRFAVRAPGDKLFIQMGTFTNPDGATHSIYFPIPFSSRPRVSLQPGNQTSYNIGGPTSPNVFADHFDFASFAGYTVDWVAIGYIG